VAIPQITCYKGIMRSQTPIKLIRQVGFAFCVAVFFSFSLPVSAALRSAAGTGLQWPFKQISDSTQTAKMPLLHYAAASESAKPFPSLAPKAYLVADLDSGLIISENNSRIPLPIASVTKLMTAVIAFENVPSQKMIIIRPSMLEPYGSSSYLAAGRQMSLAQLSYPMLLESSNDAAQAISEFLGNDKTLRMMNEKAALFSMDSTRFVDAHGLSPQNVSTAQDLFYLARYIEKNHLEILDISRGAARDVCAAGYAGIKNKNLVYDMPYFTGGKTGYIPESDYNGLFVFNVPAGGSSRKIAVIILGAPHLRAGYQNLRQEVSLSLNWIKSEYLKPAHFASKP